MKWAKKQTGFTIVELLIVVVVIAILAAITIFSYNGIQKRAYWSRVYSEVHAVSNKFEMYRVNNDTYPMNSANLSGIFADANVAVSTQDNWTYGYCATKNQYFVFPANTKAGIYVSRPEDESNAYRWVYGSVGGWREIAYAKSPGLVITRVCAALIAEEHFLDWADDE